VIPQWTPGDQVEVGGELYRLDRESRGWYAWRESDSKYVLLDMIGARFISHEGLYVAAGQKNIERYHAALQWQRLAQKADQTLSETDIAAAELAKEIYEGFSG
jgi:hypothetical protein